MINDNYNKGIVELVEDMGLSECVYNGYIDNECEIYADGEGEWLTGLYFDTYQWLCKVFAVN